MPIAPYMQWAKHRPRVANDLAASGIRAVTTAELVGEETRAHEAFSLSGPNDEGFLPLVEAIARFENVSTDRVACAAGTSGANALAILATVSRGDEVVVESPAYDPLLAVAALAGARVTRVERRFEDGYAVRPEAIAAAVGPATRLIVLTNPHNPSGAVLDGETLLAIGQVADRVGARVLIDEVYRGAPFPGEPPPLSATTLDGPFVITNSLTKAWGLAGLRIGWAAADASTAARLRRMRDLLDVIGAFPAEQLAVRAFQQLPRLTARTATILAEQWPLVHDILAACPALEYVAPRAGMMVFPRFRDGRAADAFADHLRDRHGTLVVPGRFFDAPAHFRLSFGGARDPLARGLAALASAATSG